MRGHLALLLFSALVGLLAAKVPPSTGALTEASLRLELAACRAGVVQPSMATLADESRIGIAWLPSRCQDVAPVLERASRNHGVPADLLVISALVESGCGKAGLSPAGARGLMQVMPATADHIALDRGMVLPLDWATNYEVNADFGAWYWREQLQNFGLPNEGEPWAESVGRAAMAYNGGPGHAAAVIAGGQIYAETARYRTWIQGMWLERFDDTSATFDSWCRASGGAWC